MQHGPIQRPYRDPGMPGELAGGEGQEWSLGHTRELVPRLQAPTALSTSPGEEQGPAAVWQKSELGRVNYDYVRPSPLAGHLHGVQVVTIKHSRHTTSLLLVVTCVLLKG